jgi:hypothetical protein
MVLDLDAELLVDVEVHPPADGVGQVAQVDPVLVDRDGAAVSWGT